MMQISVYAISLEVIMLSKELIGKPVEELAPLIKNKEISPVELTGAVLGQVDKTEETINAYMDEYRDETLDNAKKAEAEIANGKYRGMYHEIPMGIKDNVYLKDKIYSIDSNIHKVYGDEATDSAKKAEAEIANGKYRGMYHGIPMGIKDNVYFKDNVSTMSSKIHKDFVSDHDATVIAKLREAGVVFTGKVSMHEYAWGITNNNPHYGAVKNPWNYDKIPGGSSGGSGAAVAVGSSVASLGTDTAGSIRIPSSACGIVGLKQTHGLVSKYGVYPLAWSLDHVGPMTKTVKDAAGLLQVIAGYDKKDPTSVKVPEENYLAKVTGDVKGLVIGINEDYFFNEVDDEIETLVRGAIQTLVDQGATTKEV